MVAYADTSFLFSLYGHDANSPQAQMMGTRSKSRLPSLRCSGMNSATPFDLPYFGRS